MYVYYKDFIKHPIETIENYKDFYLNSFPELLRWYYPMWSHDGKMILDAQNHNSMADNASLLDSTNQYFFAASVFYTCLIPQVITRTAGVEARNMFLKATGWPMMSAGLGGFISPELWLKESGLAPVQGEADYFKTLLLITLPWQTEEMKKFYSGTEESLDRHAYWAFCKVMEQKGATFDRELLVTVREAGFRFLDANYPVYYLKEKELVF